MPLSEDTVCPDYLRPTESSVRRVYQLVPHLDQNLTQDGLDVVSGNHLLDLRDCRVDQLVVDSRVLHDRPEDGCHDVSSEVIKTRHLFYLRSKVPSSWIAVPDVHMDEGIIQPNS